MTHKLGKELRIDLKTAVEPARGDGTVGGWEAGLPPGSRKELAPTSGLVYMIPSGDT